VSRDLRQANASAVPKVKSAAYYAAAHRLHRIQAARARHINRWVDTWHSGLRVLCYHRISSDDDELAVSPSAFRSQMELLLQTDAKPQTLDDAVDTFRDETVGRRVCVTFDDGYYDNLENAVPVLRDLGIPATIFVPTKLIDGLAPVYWYAHPPRLLTWAELHDINQDERITIGAHTRTHRALPMLPENEAWDEIAGSRSDVEERLGRPVTSFCYPAGLYDERHVRMVSAAGYRVGVTCDPGANGPGQQPHALRRLMIGSRDNLKMFEAKVTGLLDQPWGVRDGLKTAARVMRMPSARFRNGSTA
jgi:peptidoglycan/xylan/chitin deacetylase (PgdA/CDA1 family)